MQSSSFTLLVVGLAWPPETFIQRKISGLNQCGVDILVAAQVPRLKFTPILPGIRVIRLPHPDDSILLRLMQLIGLQVQLIFQPGGWSKTRLIWSLCSGKPPKVKFNLLLHALSLARFSPDIVHFEWPSTAYEYDYLREILHVPMTVSLRGSQINIEPHIPTRTQLINELRVTFAKAQAVHCVSDAIRLEAEQYGLVSLKASVIRPAVDPDYFSPCEERATRNGIFHIITTGSLIWRKGYEFSLSAIRLLKDKGCLVKYSIIGDGIERRRVVSTLRDLDLQDEVVLLGKCAPEQIRDTLRNADVFLLSSLSEGISNAVLEAMACGLPIVTTDCGGMREAVTDGVEGFIVPVRDPLAMANSLLTLYQNSELRARMGKTARERVMKQFTLQQQINAFQQFYVDAICRYKHGHEQVHLRSQSG